MSDAMTLSVVEANKIRLAMGMAPLPVPGAPAEAPGPSFISSTQKDDDGDEEMASTVDTRQAAAHSNWLALQKEAEAKQRRQERVDALKKERERASRFTKLAGHGLADEAVEDDDVSWLKNTNKNRKKALQAEKAQREREEHEKQALAARIYDEADLANVRVGHKATDFDDGEDRILVLADKAVDEDSDDALEAIDLKEQERTKERLDAKKRKRAYDPNAAFDEDGEGSLLAQYDEKKSNNFTLDGQGRTIEELQHDSSAKPKRVAISLDILKDDAPANDYMDVSEVKIKKPKKTKKTKKSKRRHVEMDEDIFPTQDQQQSPGDMEVDQPENVAVKPKKKTFFDTNDDEASLEIQASLTAQRLRALKMREKKKNLRTPEEMARKLREEASATPDVRESTAFDEEEPGLVIDETTEFVQNLEREQTPDEDEMRQKRRKSSHVSNGATSVGETADAEGDVEMKSYAEAAEAEERKEEAQEQTPPAANNLSLTGLGEETHVDTGMGATLKLLRERGVLHKDGDTSDMNAVYRNQQKFLADKRNAEEAAERIAKESRERERNSGRWTTMSTREREEWARKNNAQRDQLEARKLAEVFNKEYKPNVQLSYVDDFGRQMNQKEAFKLLSHQFHGKGSGNTKTQKHLDKIALEKKKMAESSLETTAAGMSTAQGQQSKKSGQAGVRLL